MKRFIYSFLFLFGLLLFTGCEDITSEDTSKITNFVTFEMSGDQVFTLPVGEPYVEPGVLAIEGENDITSSMKTVGTVDHNTIGLYPITYSGTNVDGFSSSISRTVIVYNPNVTTDVSGNYTVATGSYRLRAGAIIPYSGYSINVAQVAPGVFSISDYLGGYYDQRAAYGVKYAAVGYFKLNEDNTIEPLSGDVAGWGDSISSLDDAKYDPATKEISWACNYAGMTFYVYMKL